MTKDRETHPTWNHIKRITNTTNSKKPFESKSPHIKSV